MESSRLTTTGSLEPTFGAGVGVGARAVPSEPAPEAPLLLQAGYETLETVKLPGVGVAGTDVEGIEVAGGVVAVGVTVDETVVGSGATVFSTNLPFTSDLQPVSKNKSASAAAIVRNRAAKPHRGLSSDLICDRCGFGGITRGSGTCGGWSWEPRVEMRGMLASGKCNMDLT